MRFLLSLSLLGLGTTFVFVGAAGHGDAGATASSPATVKRVRAVRADVDHYRQLTWSFELVAGTRRTPTSYAYRRIADPAHLERLLAAWQRRAYEARREAIGLLRRRTLDPLPQAPRPHAVLGARIAFSRHLTLHLRRIYPGHIPRRFAAARAGSARATLLLWQRRSARAALRVAGQARRLLDASEPLVDDLLCIHRFEGAWTADTGNGYYGGLQMDRQFMRAYGSDYLGRWGTADGWPPWAQLSAAIRAYRAGRGFGPWPNSARVCGLL